MEKQSVIIIEDDKDTATFFSTVLSLVGFDCEIYLSAKEALARLAVGVPNLILLDIRLGLEIGGEDILYQIRSNPRFDNTRVIVITAYPRLAEPITSLADLILIKPVEIEQLKSLAQRVGAFESKPKFNLFRDPVTELFNKEFFLTRLELAFERAKRRPDFLFSVVILDLQLIEKADYPIQPDEILAVLRKIGQCLRSSLRPTDAIARLAGWKFATLHEELKSPEDIEKIINRLNERLTEPIQVGDKSFRIETKYGVARYESRYKSPEDIFITAENNLEKSNG